MTSTLTQLGSRVPLPSSPGAAEIEVISFDGSLISARFQIPEFTSLCPVTGAPDFGRIVIDYVPDQALIESKSLKLFAGSFRNFGCFHEQIVLIFLDRLRHAASPRWIRVAAFFGARGGIPIDCFAVDGHLPERVFIPPLDLSPFQGR